MCRRGLCFLALLCSMALLTLLSIVMTLLNALVFALFVRFGKECDVTPRSRNACHVYDFRRALAELYEA